MQKLHHLSSRDITKLEIAIESKRDRLILQTIYETGCTVNEAVNLKIKDVDTKHNSIRFPADITKSKRSKTARISKQLTSEIAKYMDKKKKEGSTSENLFSSRQSQGITTKRARQLIAAYGIKAGLGKVLPQMIRYAHVAHAVEKGISLDAIEMQTGLDKIRLAQICKTMKEPVQEDPYKRFFQERNT